MRIGRSILAALVAAALPVSMGAQTFSVQAEIVEGCALVGSSEVSGLDFGTLAFGTVPAVFAGDVSATAVSGGVATQIWCTPGMQLQVTVDAGAHAAGGQRYLALVGGGNATIPYALYTDALHSVVIPVAGHVSVTAPAGGLLDLPIYGVASLPGGGLPPGQYADELHVTLSW